MVSRAEWEAQMQQNVFNRAQDIFEQQNAAANARLMQQMLQQQQDCAAAASPAQTSPGWVCTCCHLANAATDSSCIECGTHK